MLKIEDIYIDLYVKSKEELFYKMNEIFIEKNYVNKDYLNALLERENNYPTGLEFDGYNVAIPHVDSKYINKQKIIFIRLVQPILFKEMVSCKEINVNIIVMLLIKDHNLQIDYLIKLMNILSNKNNYHILENELNKEKIKNIFEK